MRLLTFRDDSGRHVGVLEGELIFDVSRLVGTELQTASIDMVALIEAGAPAIDQIQRRLSSPDRPEPSAT
jgi:hypothetical protein